MTNTIDNDAYLMIVYQDFDKIIVSNAEYKEIKKMGDAWNLAAYKAKTNTGSKWLKLLSAGLTNSIAQSVASKTGLPGPIVGRIQSSIYDIISDGKISKIEVAQDFIGSFTNELDSIAIKMGLPTVTALYGALFPNGTGVISKDFMKLFQKEAEKVAGEKLAQKNKVAQDLTVLKFKLVSTESESWSSGLPTRKTEKGFNIVEAIENENETRDFEISIVNNEYNGVDNMYDFKDKLYKIRDSKIPFNIYVNDPYNKKQTLWEHCFFTSLNWEPDGINSLKVSMSIAKIPEWKVKTESSTIITNNNVSKSSLSKAKSNKSKFNKTSRKEKTSSGKATIGTPTTIAAINSIKDLISQKNSFYVNSNGSVKVDVVQSKMNTLGVTTSLNSLGITKYGATSKRF